MSYSGDLQVHSGTDSEETGPIRVEDERSLLIVGHELHGEERAATMDYEGD